MFRNISLTKFGFSPKVIEPISINLNSVGKIENTFNLHDLVSLPLITGTVLYKDRPDRPCKHMHLDYDKIIVIVMELNFKVEKLKNYCSSGYLHMVPKRYAVLPNKKIRRIYAVLANRIIRCIFLCSCVFMSRFGRDHDLNPIRDG